MTLTSVSQIVSVSFVWLFSQFIDGWLVILGRPDLATLAQVALAVGCAGRNECQPLLCSTSQNSARIGPWNLPAFRA
jgi:hypothetical protein